MPQYTDIYIRDDLADTGEYPNTAATASLSPDVIVWGTQILDDPEIYLTENYGKTWYRNLTTGEVNYIYGRTKNLGPQAAEGRLYLYYSRGTLLNNPTEWSANALPTAIPGQDYVVLKPARNGQAHDISVGDSAFVWTPPSDGAHYCLVGRVVTEDHPNELPGDFPNRAAYIAWILDNPAIAWRNVSIVDASDPPDYQESYSYENLDTQRSEYLFMMSSSGLPDGSELSMVSAAIGPEPPIDGTTIVSGNATTLSLASWLPANFKADLTATVKLPEGDSWGPGMSVEIELYAIASAEEPEWFRKLGLPLTEIAPAFNEGRSEQGVAVRMGTYTIQTDTEASV